MTRIKVIATVVTISINGVADQGLRYFGRRAWGLELDILSVLASPIDVWLLIEDCDSPNSFPIRPLPLWASCPFQVAVVGLGLRLLVVEGGAGTLSSLPGRNGGSLVVVASNFAVDKESVGVGEYRRARGPFGTESPTTFVEAAGMSASSSAADSEDRLCI